MFQGPKALGRGVRGRVMVSWYICTLALERKVPCVSILRKMHTQDLPCAAHVASFVVTAHISPFCKDTSQNETGSTLMSLSSRGYSCKDCFQVKLHSRVLGTRASVDHLLENISQPTMVLIQKVNVGHLLRSIGKEKTQSVPKLVVSLNQH